ncbi:TPA: hypothetical protein ACPTMM_000096 [Escherichia coli]
MTTKDESNKNQGCTPKYGILMENCHGNIFTSSRIEGAEIGISMNASSDNKFNDTIIISAKLSDKIHEITSAIDASPLPPEIRDELAKYINEIEKAHTQKSRWQIYSELMSSINVHAELLGKIYPMLTALGVILLS